MCNQTGVTGKYENHAVDLNIIEPIEYGYGDFMKQFLFVPFLFLSFTLFAQVSFQYETRSFTQLGLTTNEEIARYLQIELSDLLPIFQHSLARGQGASISPSEFYNLISDTFNSRDVSRFLRISRELGVSFDKFMEVFAREMGGVSEADLQMMLAMYRIGLKWGIFSS